MAKISQLPNENTPASADSIPFLQNSSSSTKRFTLANLLTFLGLNQSNPYKFRAYRNAAYTTGNSVFAVIACDTELFDTGNNLDTSTNKGRFTAPVAGFYWFGGCAQELSTLDGQVVIVSLLKNSVEERRGAEIIGRNTNNLTCSVSGMIQLAQGDYVELALRANNKSGGTGKNVASFEGFLVSVT